MSAAVTQRLNEWIFIKNWYSPIKHVVPFAVAALILLVLSVPANNLLLQLADLLAQPNWIWLPAVILTATAVAIYVLTVRTQVRKAHLWSEHDLRRTITTSAAYLALCTLMAFVVLNSATANTGLVQDVTLGNIWTCLLVAALSLTGVGWSVPDSWVDSIGVKSPDYEDGRAAERELAESLRGVRTATEASKEHAQDFLSAADDLRSSIDTNLSKEPEWAKQDLRNASSALRILSEQTSAFLEDDDLATFKEACHCHEKGTHEEFVSALITLGNLWEGLKCPPQNQK